MKKIVLVLLCLVTFLTQMPTILCMQSSVSSEKQAVSVVQTTQNVVEKPVEVDALQTQPVAVPTTPTINIFVFMFIIKHCSLTDLFECYGESVFYQWLKFKKFCRNISAVMA